VCTVILVIVMEMQCVYSDIGDLMKLQCVHSDIGDVMKMQCLHSDIGGRNGDAVCRQ